jgi:hypothetical protein
MHSVSDRIGSGTVWIGLGRICFASGRMGSDRLWINHCLDQMDCHRVGLGRIGFGSDRARVGLVSHRVGLARIGVV